MDHVKTVSGVRSDPLSSYLFWQGSEDRRYPGSIYRPGRTGGSPDVFRNPSSQNSNTSRGKGCQEARSILVLFLREWVRKALRSRWVVHSPRPSTVRTYSHSLLVTLSSYLGVPSVLTNAHGSSLPDSTNGRHIGPGNYIIGPIIEFS